MSSDRLMEAVWGEDAATRTSQHLQTYMANLRRAIDKPLGRTGHRQQGAGLRPRVEPVAVDLHRFRALATEARDHMAGDRFGERRRPPSGRGARGAATRSPTCSSNRWST